ncbi:MAG: ergothioneine biosynthesis protein EgtB [Saprospiraceae bacterium]|nr:ergothioneine biosynthesis protein EgtB [Saprospiraceae bacterium]
MKLSDPSATVSTSSSLITRFNLIRKQTLAICKPLHPEDYVVQPIDFVSPPKWHLGHTTWFFENFILAPHLASYQLFDERLNWFFNSYYESQGPRILRTKRGNMTRPNLERILEYRRYVDQHMQAFLDSREAQLPEELKYMISVGLQHEQQHQELLLMDIKYILGNNPLFPAFAEKKMPESGNRPVNYLPVSEGIYEIGHQGTDFCWDNELGRHKVYLPDFEIQDRLVTNGEYLEFIQDGGYENHEFWLSEGWEWLKTLELKVPLYWYPRADKWYEYTMAGIGPIDLNKPVAHISYFEAEAYARWKGLRLPTEFEWEAAFQIHGKAPTLNAFLESGFAHPLASETAEDNQLLGHLWEWTASAYLPYPNFPRFKGALGEYNGKFMVNQMILRGGSAATPISHIRSTYRNFFHANMRWQFSGIRLVKDNH